MLRDYQKNTLEQLYAWMQNNKGNPCIELPTGSGKSIIVAAICQDALKVFNMKKVIMLVHVKELIEQNAEKMRLLWPGAPLGIYSAGVGRKEIDEPITFAGIQSVNKKADIFGSVDLVIIDECHLCSHKEEGGYRSFIGSLLKVNPLLRVIGLSATPYRLGHGLITEKPAIFDDIIKPISIKELIEQGYLSTLRSKDTLAKIDVSGVGKRGGEYIEAELQDKVDQKDQNARIVSEVIAKAGDRKTWLFFCAGVKHAEHVAEELRLQGISAECLTGATSKAEREGIIHRLRSGSLRALTNANVLTTGFDCPDIDLVVLMRPTMSPGLYIQQVGRGMRLKSHTDHCLVLDFAGVVAMHGPVTMVQPPKKGGSGKGEAPVKLCPLCFEICHTSVRVCTSCGTAFPPPQKKELFLHDDCIMGIENSHALITGWSWQVHMTNKQIECLLIKYNVQGRKTPIVEYLLVLHPGWVGQSANKTLKLVAEKLGVKEELQKLNEVSQVARLMNATKSPAAIEYKKEGKYPLIIQRLWNESSNI
jgi:DNA repair protein RadD